MLRPLHRLAAPLARSFAASRRRAGAAFALAGALALAVAPPPAVRAQTPAPLHVTETSPAPGAVGVPLEARLQFHFSAPLPLTGTGFIDKIDVLPGERIALATSSDGRPTYGHAFDASERLTIAFLDVVHEPETDYAAIVFGVRSGSGAAMARPHVLRYTTAAAAGTRTVSGRAAFAERVYTLGPGASAVKNTASAPQLAHSVVLLLDYFTFRSGGWPARAAAALDGEGRFEMDAVRDGVYWPVALTFASAEGVGIAAYGFHDPDGDLQPDSLVVRDGDVSGLTLDLYPVAPATAAAYAELAVVHATSDGAAFELIEIASLGEAAVQPGGTALRWRFTYYDAANARTRIVDVDPVTLTADTFDGTPYQTVQQPIPAGYVDSDAALAAADAAGGAALRARYGADAVTVAMTAGDLDLQRRPARPSRFWNVRYETPDGPVSVFVDLTSGAVLNVDNPQSIGTETTAPTGRAALAPPYPNPAAGAVDFVFTLDRSSDVGLSVYDLMGRRVRTLVRGARAPGTHRVVWDGEDDAGRPVPAGAYLVRMTADGASYTDTVVRLSGR